MFSAVADRRGRAIVDDRPATATLHRLYGVERAVNGAQKIRSQRVLPTLEPISDEIRSGIIHQDVESAETAFSGRNERTYIGFVSCIVGLPIGVVYVASRTEEDEGIDYSLLEGYEFPEAPATDVPNRVGTRPPVARTWGGPTA